MCPFANLHAMKSLSSPGTYSSRRPSLIRPWCSLLLLPSLMHARKWEGTARKHTGTVSIWKEEKLSETFARCWYWSRQEEGASGNSPASSEALQMKQSQETLGGSCQWHSPPPPFLPARLHHSGAGGVKKWGGSKWAGDSTFPNSALKRKLEGGWYGNSLILCLLVSPRVKTQQKKEATYTNSVSLFTDARCPLFIPAEALCLDERKARQTVHEV